MAPHLLTSFKQKNSLKKAASAARRRRVGAVADRTAGSLVTLMTRSECSSGVDGLILSFQVIMWLMHEPNDRSGISRSAYWFVLVKWADRPHRGLML